MHISKEFLMEAFGLSLLVALIMLGSQMFQRAIELTNRLEQRQEEKIVELEEYEVTRYDGMKVDGVTITGYIKTVVSEYSLPVHVTTGKGSFTVAEKEKYAELRNMESEYYINPLALYHCGILRDENGSLSGVEINVVKEGDK